MNFDLTPEQEQIRKLAKDFADNAIAPGARERDRGQTQIQKLIIGRFATGIDAIA